MYPLSKKQGQAHQQGPSHPPPAPPLPPPHCPGSCVVALNWLTKGGLISSAQPWYAWYTSLRLLHCFKQPPFRKGCPSELLPVTQIESQCLVTGLLELARIKCQAHFTPCLSPDGLLGFLIGLLPCRGADERERDGEGPGLGRGRTSVFRSGFWH